MRRKQEEKIGSLLDLFVRSNNLERGLAEYRVKKLWPELLGKAVAKATKDLYIKDNVLFVRLHSSVVSSELSAIKDQIISRLNEGAGMQVIRDIVFR